MPNLLVGGSLSADFFDTNCELLHSFVALQMSCEARALSEYCFACGSLTRFLRRGRGVTERGGNGSENFSALLSAFLAIFNKKSYSKSL